MYEMLRARSKRQLFTVVAPTIFKKRKRDQDSDVISAKRQKTN